MKVLLTKDVSGLGRPGDIKEVSDGHARNFLIPRHLVLPATSALLQRVQKEEGEKQAKYSREQERLQAFKNKINGKTFTMKGKAQGQNLFAAIHEKEIAQALAEKFGIEIAPASIRLDKAVKNLGRHDIKIKFGQDAEALVHLNVEQL